jgi:hypothetical protein
MGIVELYSDDVDTVWNDQKTSLCVLDDNNNLIADYDFRTGLRLLKSDTNFTIYINNDDLIPGKWVLFVTKIYEGEENKTIKVEGSKEGVFKERIFEEDRPWDFGYSNQLHVSRQERENRLSVCKSCPFFNIENMTCEVDGENVLDKTKYLDEYCPEEKWGDKKAVMQKISRNATIISQQDQQEFESELEEFLKGK